jgi:hypothetical protein
LYRLSAVSGTPIATKESPENTPRRGIYGKRQLGRHPWKARRMSTAKSCLFAVILNPITRTASLAGDES